MRLLSRIIIATSVACMMGVVANQGKAQNLMFLGDLPGGDFDSSAFDVSADGSVVVGHGESDEGREAFLWTAESGIRGFGELPGGLIATSRLHLSADGSAIVGEVGSEEGREVFLWTRDRGKKRLGDLQGGQF